MVHKLSYFIFVFLLLLGGCKSSVPLGSVVVKKIPLSEVLENCDSSSFRGSNLYLRKCQFSYALNGKSQTFNGSLFLQVDSFIIVSVQALLGIEVARIKITPKEVFIIDRFHKQIITTSFSTFTDAYAKDLNFNAIQQILCNKLFSIDTLSNGIADVNHFKLFYLENGYGIKSVEPKSFFWRSSSSKPYFLSNFIVEPSTFLLIKSVIVRSNLSSSISIDYSSFVDVSGIRYPTNIDGLGQVNSSEFSFSIHSAGVQINSANGINFNIPIGYDKVVK